MNNTETQINKNLKHNLQKELNINNTTIKSYTAALSIILSFAVRNWGYIKDNPVFKTRRK